MAGMLNLIPTPIGNLADLSTRAVRTLAHVDFIAAEDTRVTVKLLNFLNVKKPMVIYHRHNADTAGQEILQRLLAGEEGALVTDAGTPAISDPGEDLVKLCAEHGVEVTALPGPCALTTALSVSGQSTERFVFEGFLPMKKKNRMARLDAIRFEERTIVLYEAPHKLRNTLADLSAALGAGRPISICRELTKLHEQILRTTLGKAYAYYENEEPRGEYVLVIGGADSAPEQERDPDGAFARVKELEAQGRTLKEAVKQAAGEFGYTRNEMYAVMVDKMA